MSGETRAASEPRTLQEKVQHLLERTFPAGMSGRKFTQIVKDKGGSLSHAHFSNIVRGEVTEVSEDTLRALGLGFGVDWRYFKDESELEADVVAGLQFLADKRAGTITGLAGRNIAASGLTPELLKFALSLVAQERQRRAEDAHAEPSPRGPRVC
ncbi:hypothetical protein AB0O47_32490 [Streptomyces noursei]|uniref:hypothetical protein n=1 Tax=Streptomyces noursei TaxID=1971 RepID=UPI00344FD71C